jgi:hypothetical protein
MFVNVRGYDGATVFQRAMSSLPCPLTESLARNGHGLSCYCRRRTDS